MQLKPVIGNFTGNQLTDNCFATLAAYDKGHPASGEGTTTSNQVCLRSEEQDLPAETEYIGYSFIGAVTYKRRLNRDV